MPCPELFFNSTDSTDPSGLTVITTVTVPCSRCSRAAGGYFGAGKVPPSAPVILTTVRVAGFGGDAGGGWANLAGAKNTRPSTGTADFTLEGAAATTVAICGISTGVSGVGSPSPPPSPRAAPSLRPARRIAAHRAP